MSSIDIFPWNENFNTDIQIIDEQHQRLVQLLNLLANHVAFHSDIPALNVIFDELADYAVYHFQTEEAIWHQYLPEDALEITHKVVHARFVETVLKLKAEESTKPGDQVVEAVLAFLTRWLAAHILESDRYLAMVVLARQSGLSLESAKTHAHEQMSGSTRVLIDIILAIYESLSSNTLHLMRELANRKQMEVALAESHHLLKSIIDTAPMRIFWKDKDSCYLGCNPVFAKDAGKTSPEALIGKDDYQMGWKAQAASYQADDRQVMATGSPKLAYNEPQTTPDGNLIWLQTSKVPLRNTRSEIIGVLGIYQDVTEQKQAADELRKFSLVVEQSPSSIVITDLDANIEFVNEAFVKATGYRRDEAIGYNPKLLHSGKTSEETYKRMWATLTRGEVWKGEFVNRRKDGSEYTEQALIAPVHQLNGETTHYLAIKDDITERKNLEQQLKAQLSFTQAVIDAEVDGMAVCHGISEPPYACFTVWNPSMEVITGYCLEEINTLGWYQTVYIDPDVQARAKQRMERMRQGDHLHGEEWIITRKDGERRTVQIYTTICASDAKGVHVLAVMRDITERKQAEIALRESHQQMYSLLNAMAEGAYGVDINGNCTFVNRSFLRILGYENADEIIGKHIHELIHYSYPDGRSYPATECRMYNAYRHNKEIHVTDEVFWRKDGIAVPVEYWSEAIITDGVVTGAIATFVDITERKKAETVTQATAQYARSLIEASLDPLVTIDVEGKITDVNTATEQVTGVDRHHLIGSDFADYFTEPEKARAGYQQVFLQGLVTDYPLSIRHTSGSITYVLYNATVYRDSKGNVLGVFAAARDITERKQIEDRLTNSESYLRTIIENEPECIKIVDARGRIVQMNPAGLKIVEADTAEQVVGKSVLNVIAPEYRSAFVELHNRVLAGEAMQMEYEVIGLKGGRRWLDTHAVPIKDTNGNVVHLAVTRDISDRKQAEYQLRIAATVFESQEGMIVTDDNNAILRVNRAFTEITGYTAEDAIGKNPSLLQSDQQNQDFYSAMWESVKNTGTWSGEIYNRHKNGKIYPEYLTITAVKNQQDCVTHYVGTLTDITLRKAAAEEIERLAFYDPLTGLPNRRLLYERLKSALTSSHRSGRLGALLFIDLDNFKTLNDTLGHDMGDLLLQQVAQRLKACVREGDTVARLGGDEFVVMLQYLSEQTFEAATQTEAIGNKILMVLNQPYLLATHHYLSTPSIGGTLFNGYEQSVEELLKHADIAMYQAKSSGRNAFRFFDPQMQADISARAALEADLRTALAKNQFVLYYQPQVCHNGHIIGAEVLIRWQHPQQGLVSPLNFIPLAEETGLILPIGQWVLETACAQLKAWEDQSRYQHLQLAVNVSARQFRQAGFVAQVTQVLRTSAINTNRLKLELTESLVIDDIGDTIIKMKALKEIGVCFSMDDFGTGYSSLSSLKKLPIDQLKIDQSFMRDILGNSDDAVIVQTIIAMTKHLGMEVIAEGVETQAQRAFLEQHGCPVYQGYLFSKPVPIEQFEALRDAQLSNVN